MSKMSIIRLHTHLNPLVIPTDYCKPSWGGLALGPLGYRKPSSPDLGFVLGCHI